MEISKALKSPKLWLAMGLIVLGVGWRLAPHTANFAPLGAIALLSGLALKGRGTWITLAVLAITDSLIGFYGSMIWTWGAFVAISVMGIGLRRYSSFLRIGLGVPLTALSFFVISNFGTWLTSGMYALTWAGLVDCYTMALPFFRATALSDMLFGVTLVGGYSVVQYLRANPVLSGSIPRNTRHYLRRLLY